MRVVALIGSIMVGLVITNIIYLLVINDSQELLRLPNGDLMTQSNNGTFVLVETENESEVIKEYTEIQLDSGMLVLWTIGGAVHAIWDNTIWYLTSLSCFDPDKPWVPTAKRFCNFAVVIGCILLTVAATAAVIVRAHVEGGGEVNSESFNAHTLESDSLSNKDNYEFLISYGVELFMAWFIWFPIIETFLFSGILGYCFPCVPFLQGRPQEVQREKERDLESSCEFGTGRRGPGSTIGSRW